MRRSRIGNRSSGSSWPRRDVVSAVDEGVNMVLLAAAQVDRRHCGK